MKRLSILESALRAKFQNCKRLALVATLAAGVQMIFPPIASAELSVCNDSESRVAIAVGYKDGEDWTTEGWWNLQPGACEAILPQPLGDRFYYLFARDWDTGGDWGGATPMCTQTKIFTIKGVQECLSRGFVRAGFSEIDTGEARAWTVRLSPKKGPDG